MNVLNISKVYPLSYMCDERILYIETFPADGRPAQYSVSILDPCLRPEPELVYGIPICHLDRENN